MITFFTISKPFLGHIAIIQKNAIRSWKYLDPHGEIYLCGNETGTHEAAKELDIHHVASIKTNSHGTPLLSDAFEKTKRRARNRILCYSNADIIFTREVKAAVTIVSETLPLFVIVGRRMDLDIKNELRFDAEEEKQILFKAKERGSLHGYSGIDYFIFPKNLPLSMPAFAVGRSGWDNWFIYEMRRKKIPVIDASHVITAIHQNHDYLHHSEGQRGTHYGEEAQENWKLAGGAGHLMDIRGASHTMTRDGLRKPAFMCRLYSLAHLAPPLQKIVKIMRARKLQKHL